MRPEGGRARGPTSLGSRSAAPRLRLFCFPYGGAGGGAFRGWKDLVPADVEPWAVNLPGREARYGEPMPATLRDLARQAAQELAPRLDRPFAFFGHSMGALLAFEVARRLAEAGLPAPRKLIASGYGAPQLPLRSAPIHHLPDDAMLAELARAGGVSADLLAAPEILEVILPTLRQDIALCERYAYAPAPPLRCDLAAFGGEADPDVSPEELRGWASQATGRFTCHVFPGGHFFLHEQRERFAQALSGELADTLRGLDAPAPAPAR